MRVQDIIKKRRLELGLTMKDVAKILGVSEATVSRYESGEIQNMGIDKVEALSRALQCSPGFLMGWEHLPAASEAEAELIEKYRRLNPSGKQKLTERAEELIELGYVEKGDGAKMA